MARQPKNMPTEGTAAYDNVKNVSGSPERGTLVKKGHSKGDTTLGTKAQPAPTMERLGASYKIGASVAAPIVDPAAGATQSSGRTIRPVTNRITPNFYQSMADIQAS